MIKLEIESYLQWSTKVPPHPQGTGKKFLKSLVYISEHNKQLFFKDAPAISRYIHLYIYITKQGESVE